MKLFLTKKLLSRIGLVLMLLSGTTLFLTGCGPGHDAGAAAKEETLYTCGMHPQVIQNKPGNCPICGMKLTPIRKPHGAGGTATNAGSTAGERKVKYYKSTMMPGEVSATPRKDSMGMDMVPVYEEEAAAAESSVISIDPVTVQNMDLRTGLVTRGPLRRTVRTVGAVDFDETTLTEVTTKFKGWIEKLYVDTTGQQVHRGQALFDIYSPDLYSAQVEYLLALHQSTNFAGAAAQSLKASALAKLKFYDIGDEQIAEIEKSGQPQKTLRITAPRDGVVVEKMAVEGQMVDAGMKLYRLADLATVWVQSQVYEQDLPLVRLGQEAAVSLSYLPDRKFRGRVTYVYPTVDEKTRTAKVRMEFHNPGYFLKPGMFATVELTAEVAPAALLVPDMAILRSGEKNTVFVALDGGRFEPRTVTIGLRSQDNMYQVLSGLSEGERVVTSGQFMLDSESQLREAIQKMMKPSGAEPAAEHPQTAPAPAGATNAPAESEKIVYICPMPEHVSLEYDHPGKCPLCGMTLVPVSKETLAKIQPGGRIEYWTCPMPEHSDVHAPKPGKCPHCGMTLVPVMVQPKPNLSPGQSTNGLSNGAARLPAKLYTCPMAEHADVVSDQPGLCPKCEMKLVETTEVSHGKIAEANWLKEHQTGTPAGGNSTPEAHHH